jgi:hypothetical protein
MECREDAEIRDLPYNLKQKEREKQIAEIRERAKADWSTVPAGDMLEEHFSHWNASSVHEQRLENQFYKAMRELRQWRAMKAKEKNEPTEQESTVDQTPVSEQREEPDFLDQKRIDPIQQNEPTEVSPQLPIPELEPSPAPPMEGVM